MRRRRHARDQQHPEPVRPHARDTSTVDSLSCASRARRRHISTTDRSRGATCPGVS
jgi:hypothetical protein